MSEEKVTAAETEALKEEEEVVEEISEDDLTGVAGGIDFTGKDLLEMVGEDPPGYQFPIGQTSPASVYC